jgi:lipase maturation factor 1
VRQFYLIEQLNEDRQIVYDLYLRLLGFIYFCAFISLVVQIHGLIGSRGILPAGDYLKLLEENSGRFAYFGCPTLLWAVGEGHLDLALSVLTIGGSLLALLLIAGVYRFFCTVGYVAPAVRIFGYHPDLVAPFR